MAYQNVSKPRFYVSILQWLDAIGSLSSTSKDDGTYAGGLLSKAPNELVHLNPSKQARVVTSLDTYWLQFQSTVGNYDTLMPNDNNFFMVLGHNFGWNSTKFQMRKAAEDGSPVASTSVVNYNSDGSEYDGFSIAEGDNAYDLNHDTIEMSLWDVQQAEGEDIKFGSVLYGTYYDMPYSPDLSLNLNREYKGTSTITTYNGSSFSNTIWTKPPKWGALPAWELSYHAELDKYILKPSKSGRRVWDLKFSFVSDNDIFSSNESIGKEGTLITTDLGYEEDDIGDVGFKYNLLTDDSFYSQVWHKTLNGTLPFVFQPDKDNSNPDQFAICRFVDNSFKVEQSAHNIYNVSLKIMEVW
jgi:hypothetical protein